MLWWVILSVTILCFTKNLFGLPSNKRKNIAHEVTLEHYFFFFELENEDILFTSFFDLFSLNIIGFKSSSRVTEVQSFKQLWDIHHLNMYQWFFTHSFFQWTFGSFSIFLLLETRLLQPFLYILLTHICKSFYRVGTSVIQ